MNLLANDVNRFDVVSIFVHTLWASPLCVILIGILLYYEIGWASFVGIFVIFLVVPLQCKYCKYFRKIFNKIYLNIDFSLYGKTLIPFSFTNGFKD